MRKIIYRRERRSKRTIEDRYRETEEPKKGKLIRKEIRKVSDKTKIEDETQIEQNKATI